MTGKTDAKIETILKLDTAKLLGFRNLSVVMDSASDVQESADLAFTKKGTESVG